MQSLKIKTTLRILTTVFAVIPMLIVGIVGYFSMTGFAANSVSQFARAVRAMMPSQCFRSLPRISPTETAASRTL